MGKLRHVALYARDIEATAAFYERAFEMTRVLQTDSVIALSDGVVSLAIADVRRNPAGKTGLDHVGFLVNEMDAAAAKLESAGAVHCGQIKRSNANAGIERKYRAPDGVVFDVATPDHARAVWMIPV